MILADAIGKRTRRDIFNDKGILLIPRHVIILEEHLDLLYNHGVYLNEDDLAIPVRSWLSILSKSLMNPLRWYAPILKISV